jgi:hypothetical protein
LTKRHDCRDKSGVESGRKAIDNLEKELKDLEAGAIRRWLRSGTVG